MNNLAVLLVAVLATGCASLDDAAYMPSESQLKFENPYLLNCPAGRVAVCNSNGSRIRKTFTHCTCAR